jgi:hypothetical protein
MTTPLNRLATLAVLAAALAACGSDRQSPAPESTATIVAAKDDRPDGDGNGIPDAITVKGRLGDTLALAGSGLNDDPSDHTKSQIKVTLKAIKGPFKGYDIASDRKLIGIVLRFSNAGRLEYSNPLPHGTLTLAGGESGKQTSLITVGAKSPCTNPRVRLAAGQSKNVCIAFEVPKRGKPQAFEYIADSGYGDTGLWTLGR